MGYEQMENGGPSRFLAAAVSGQSHLSNRAFGPRKCMKNHGQRPTSFGFSTQREQGHWERAVAHQQSGQYRSKDGGQHLAAQQNLSGSAVPSIPNQVGGSHRHQSYGGQAGPPGLPHAALRDEIRGPRSGLLRT